MNCLRTSTLMVGALAVLLSGAASAAPPQPTGAVVEIDGATTTTAIPAALEGYAYDPRVALPRMRPPVAATYRLDAGLEHLYDCRTGHLRSAGVRQLNAQLDTIEALRAAPIVILDYMPACLAATVPGDPRDPRLLPARSAAGWQRVIAELVTAIGPGRAARNRKPVRYLEAWNEPDGLFWQGTLADYINTILLPAGRAVSQVAKSSGMSFRFSVAATTFPDPAWQTPLLRAAAHNHIPVGFVSWHYYANYPALGPDGGEPGENPAIAAAAGHENPAADPLTFGAGVQTMRATARTALGFVPELALDEWNLSAGGFDLRNDTHVGAAFQAATLIELASSGLDRALLYASVDPHSTGQTGRPLPVRHGDWGVVDRTGARKPAWYAQQLFASLRGKRLTVPVHPEPDLWLSATRDSRTIHLLAAAFTAHTEALGVHHLTVHLHGLPPGTHHVSLTRIDAQHSGLSRASASTVHVDLGGTATLSLELKPNAIALLEVDTLR